MSFYIITILSYQPKGHPDFHTICQIQGAGTSSPFVGETVRTEGIVYADFDAQSHEGFFIEEENCDSVQATSDGIFISLGTRADIVTPGERVRVTGSVEEHFGRTQINALPGSVTRLSSNHPLPEPVNLSPPENPNAARSYLESRESMFVKAVSATVVGPTNGRGETFVIRPAHRVKRIFRDHGPGPGVVFTIDNGGQFPLPTPAKSGDTLAGVQGPLHFSVGLFRLLLIAPLEIIPGPEINPHTPQNPLIVSFNIENLFDTHDDPDVEDTVLSPSEYQRRLQKRALAIHALAEPPIIALQEVENASVLQALANRPELEANYGFLWVDGPDFRGIDVALFYRQDRVMIIDAEVRQGCTQLVDGFGPDGNRDPENPTNAQTCDIDGDNIPDGNRLFSRPPLIVRLRVCPEICTNQTDPKEMWVIVNHWKSKNGDTEETAFTLPRRLEQAEFVARLANDLQVGLPIVPGIVIGDFNDYIESEPISVLKSEGLVNVMEEIPANDRYSYIYRGISQTLDHMFVTSAFHPGFSEAFIPRIFHINSDFPAQLAGDGSTFHRSSDHDPIYLEWWRYDYFEFLPMLK